MVPYHKILCYLNGINSCFKALSIKLSKYYLCNTTICYNLILFFLSSINKNSICISGEFEIKKIR